MLARFMNTKVLSSFKKNNHYLRWIGLALFVAIFDQTIKSLIIIHIKAYQPIIITSFFNLFLSFNRGAAFSFLNNASGWQNWLFGAIAITISIFIINLLYRTPKKQLWTSISLSFILGGALGNLIDRLWRGAVIDFLDFHFNTWHWATFNIADSAIVVGFFILFLTTLKKNK